MTWSTFGTWLPGDRRGFRARDHKIHSSGTYKNPPPPEEHASLRAYARRVMHKDEVVLSAEVQSRALDAIVEKAGRSGIPITCLAVGKTHVHALLALDPETLEKDVGRLKRFSSHALRDAIPGALWSGGYDTRVLWDDAHSVQAVRYILNHAEKEGAAVWRRVAGGVGER